MTYESTKRVFDVVIATLASLIFLPIVIILGGIILITMGSPIFFCQRRTGLHGKPFKLYKFRTMTDERDEHGNLLPDEQRLTEIGRFIRTTSLDELPQLLNVIRGSMSLVGPRPLLMQYLERYTPEQNRRHEVKPGITGWSQINGRNAISWEQKFISDVWYVEQQSFWLDAKIIVWTMWNWLKRKDINQPGHATVDEFMGTHVRSPEVTPCRPGTHVTPTSSPISDSTEIVAVSPSDMALVDTV